MEDATQWTMEQDDAGDIIFFHRETQVGLGCPNGDEGLKPVAWSKIGPVSRESNSIYRGQVCGDRTRADS